MTNATPRSLGEFLDSAYARALSATERSSFSASQRTLLAATLGEHRNMVAGYPAADPVSLFYFVPKAHGREISEQAQQLAAYGTLLTLAGKILDDVQDADFSKGALKGVSAPVALNTGLTLLMLSVEQLELALWHEPLPAKRSRFIKCLSDNMLDGLAGQHRDVEGLPADASLEECLAVARAKGGGFVIFLESAALCAGCSEEEIARYRESALNVALLRQIVDDVRDVFGKASSPDLSTGKATSLVAYFRGAASPSQLEDFESLCKQLPSSLPAIRKLFYESGAVRLCAEKIEELRREIHRAVTEASSASAAMRTWLQVIDSLAGMLYTLPRLEESASLFEPEGPWHDRVRNAAREMVKHLEPFSPPELPRLIPWSRREWMYDLRQRSVFYSDVSGQPEEILPVQQEMLGLDSPVETERLLFLTAPMTMAHEYFHYWRHASGNYCGDWWFEEWAANRLAVAYAQRHRPELVGPLKEIAERILGRTELTDAGKAILERYATSGYGPGDSSEAYGVSMSDLVAVQVASTLRLLGQPLSLEAEIAQLLGGKPA